MERKETLKEILDELNRRKRSTEALRLLVEEGDADTALAMCLRLKTELDAIIARLRDVTGAEDGAPTSDAAVPSELKGYLGDAERATGFELWIENAVDSTWNTFLHPARALKKLDAHRTSLIFLALLALAVFSGWQAYQKTFSAEHGLTGEYYADEDFKTLFAKRQDNAVNFRWLRRPPMRDFRAEHFSIRWTGVVRAVDAGVHTFYTVSDDGVRLWIDDQLLVDNWNIHGGTLDKGEISLTPGYHRIRLEYFQSGGDSVMKLQWKQPTDREKRNIPSRLLFPRQPED